MSDPRDFYRPDAGGQNFRPDRGLGIAPAAASSGLNVIPYIEQPVSTVTEQATKALGSLMPALEAFSEKRVKAQTEEEIQAGREAALTEATDYAEAVRSGKLAPNKSPWFMKGYKAQYGENVGQQWAAEAKTAWMQSEAKNSDDPNAAATFIREFTAKKLGTVAGLDPDVRVGLLPKLSAMHGAVMTAQAEYSSQQVYSKNLELFGTAVTNDISEYIAAGGKMSTADLFAKIKSRDAAGRLQGVNNDDLNKTIAEAIVQKARETGSLQLLKLGQQYTNIGNNPKYLGMFRGAEDAITTKAMAQETRALAMEARNVRVNGQRALMNVFDGLLAQQKNGESPRLTNEMIAGLKQSGNPEAGITALKLMQDQQEKYEKLTPAETAAIYNRVSGAGSQGALNEANLMLTEGLIKGQEGAKLAFGLAKEFADNHIYSSKPYTEGTSRLEALGRSDVMGPSMINPAAVNEAVTGYQRDFVIWKTQNPKATDAEVDSMKNRLIESYSSKLESYKMSGDKFGGDFQRGAITGSSQTQQPQAPAPRVQDLSTEDLIRSLGNSPRITPQKPNQKTK